MVLIEEIEKNHGSKFVNRDAETITISLNEKLETYKIVKIYEFSSDRKMMSITVESPDGKTINFAKGADMAFKGKIVGDTQDMPEINDYAKKGLRTLMFAMSHQDLEDNYSLLGVTGVEDLLQDNVQPCIQQFMDADIKVWMLTGDKGETAR